MTRINLGAPSPFVLRHDGSAYLISPCQAYKGRLVWFKVDVFRTLQKPYALVRKASPWVHA